MNAVADAIWSQYQPTIEAPWTLRRVVHLHRRAGFAATWDEIQRDLRDGPAISIDRILAGQARSHGVPDDFDRIAGLLADAAVNSRDPARIKAWWIYRMLFGPDSLGERLKLMWHNHFATSNLKINDLAMMRRQNEIFREFGRAPFGELLNRAVRDPALLIWLDAQANRKEHPNENLGRELLELFTLGVGHYAEMDVKDAARALTGWTVSNRGFREFADRHEDGEKTILSRTGAWCGDDLIRILLEHPATAERLAFRICELFMGENALDRPAIEALAAGLRKNNLDIRWGVETVLRSQAFFSESNIGNRVLSPVEFVIGSVRALEQFDPPPSTLVLAEWVARLGQDLFYPPNVFGWPGGRAWITTLSVVGRANFASTVVEGGLGPRTKPLDASAILRRFDRGEDLEAAAAFFSELILGVAPSDALRDRLAITRGSVPSNDPRVVRRIVSLILAAPETQLA